MCYNVARMNDTLTRQAKPKLLRARCSEELKRDVAQVAKLKELDESDIVRIAVALFVRQVKNPNMLHV